MAYLLSNICIKNYWNRTTIVEIIVGCWVVSFLRHSVREEMFCDVHYSELKFNGYFYILVDGFSKFFL